MQQKRLENRRERQKEGLEKMWYNEMLNSFNPSILSKNKYMGDVISLIISIRGKCQVLKQSLFLERKTEWCAITTYDKTGFK